MQDKKAQKDEFMNKLKISAGIGHTPILYNIISSSSSKIIMEHLRRRNILKMNNEKMDGKSNISRIKINTEELYKRLSDVPGIARDKCF